MPRPCFFAFFLAIAVVIGNSGLQAQSNDNFGNRLTLTGSHPTAVSNNLHATSETGEPDHAGAGAGRSLWYTWTAPASGTVNIGTYDTMASAPTMRAVAVYTGGTLGTLTEVASSNDLAQLEYLEGFYPFVNSLTGTSINVPVTTGTVYQIAIDALAASWFPDDGTTVLAINAPPTILSAANATATTGSSFSYAVVATGGPTAYAAANLPAGLVINAATGQITGTAAAAGTYTVGLSATGPGGTGTATLTLRFTDPVTAVPTMPVIENAMSLLGYVGTLFSTYVEASGSPTSYTASNLPAGLTLNTSTGALTGTPTAAGIYTVPVSATNAVGTSSATLTINIITPSLSIITSALAASATTGTAFTYYIDTNLDGYSGLAPTGWTATNLPPGLTLGTGSNSFGGTPTQAGVYPVAISATNAAGTRQAVVTVTITAPPTTIPTTTAPVLSSRAIAQGVVGTAFGYTLAATQSPTSFGASNLPPGVTFGASTGAFAGTPTAAGTFQLPVTASNAFGTSTGTLTVTIFANSAAQLAANGVEKPVLASAASAVGYVGQSFTYNLVAEVEGSPYFSATTGTWTFSATGLPPGLSVTSSGSTYGGFGTIAGTPTQTGTYAATITVTSPAGYPESYPYQYNPYGFVHPAATSTAVVTFAIKNGTTSTAPVVTSSATYSATVGSAVYDYVSVSGSPTSYAASGLPPGLGISTTSGEITGTPTQAGTYAATISAANAVGTGTATITFIVAAHTSAPLITSSATASGTVGSSFSYSVYVSGGANSYGASNLPPGLSFGTSSGAVTGTPTQTGVYTVPISATNAVGTANATLTITILSAAAATHPPAITSYAVAQATTGQSFYYYFNTDVTATSYAVGGSLPPGLTFTAGSGYISGTPTQAGTYTVPISATNAAGTGSAMLTIIVASPSLPVFTSPCALAATVGQSFYSTVSASNYPTSYTFSGLPAGITQNSSSPGYLSGTPTATGTYSVAVGATNSTGTTSATLTITVTPATTTPPVITSAAGAAAYIGSSFAYTVQASGSPTSYTVGALPTGLSFNASTHVLSGVPTAAGTYTIPLSAANAAGTCTASLSLLVSASDSSPPVVTSPAEIVASQRQPFFYAITTDCPATAYQAGSLPSGVTLDTRTGVISGTLATTGTYLVPVTVTGSGGQTQATLTIVVSFADYAVFTQPAAFSGVIGQAFTGTIVTSASDNYSPTASPLPSGLSINGSTGIISGYPTTVGNVTAAISEYTEYGYVYGKQLLTISGVTPTVPVVSSPAAAILYVGLPFTYQIRGTNSPTAFTASGLPPGLTFNAATGVITGTPTTAGTYVVSAAVRNAQGISATASLEFTAETYEAPAQVLSAASVEAVVGAPLSYTLIDSTTLTNVSWVNLPPGLSFNSGTNLVSGTPTAAGTYTATVYAAGTTYSSDTCAVTFHVAAAASSAPVVTSAASASAVQGNAFSYALSASNGPTAYSASNLAAGLVLNPTTGAISGTLTAAGTYSISLAASNGVGTGSGTLTLVVAGPAAPTISASNVLEQTATVGTSYSVSIIANGAVASYGASGLPPGLSVNPTSGLISGTPTAAGIYPVTISAANASGGASAVVSYVISSPSLAPPVIAYLTESLTAFVGVPISTTSLSATNSPTAYAGSGLPPGLVLSAANGQITGTPTAAGNYTVNLSATNAAGTGTAVWTVVVNNASVLYPVLSNLAAEFSGTVGQSSDYDFYAYTYYGGSQISAPTTITVSGLPMGLQVDGSGTNYTDVYGTPTAAGTYPLTLTATAPGGATATASCVLVVLPAPAPMITSAAGVLGNVNNVFSYSLSASNTVTAYTVSTLPAGLTLNTSTGQIAGTPTTMGTTVVPVSATGPYGTASAAVTIRVDPPLYGGLPVITSAAAISSQNFLEEEEEPYYYYPYNYAGSVVNYALTALNGAATFTLGNLPAGMVFNPYNNVISGQPVTAGVFQVPVTATNAAGTISTTLTIISGAPTVIAGPPLAQSGYVGGGYSGAFSAYYPSFGTYTEPYEYPYYYGYEGVETNPVTFTAAGLPPGLSINGDEGMISGTFTRAGTYPVTLTASNLAGAGGAVCTFAVAANAPASTGATTAPMFSGQAQAAGFVGVPLSYYLYGSGTSSYAASGLPAGLALNPSTGQISGTPTTAGIYPVTVSAANSAGTTQAVLTVTVDDAPPAPVLGSECTATATVGTAFYYYIDAYGYYSNLPAATGYAASGLPAGLSLNTSTGEIGGVPTGPAGVYTVPVTAFVGPVTTLGGYLTLTVQNPPVVPTPPMMTSAAGALGLMGNSFSYAIYSAAFVPSIESLPPGLSYNAVTGVISGYPTAAGTYVVPLGTAGTSDTGGVNRRKSSRRPIQTNGGDTSLTSVLTICVLAPDLSLPRLVTQPGGGATMEGGNFTFSAAAVGAPAPTYQWQHNGIAVPDATAASLTLEAVQPADSGIYTVTAVNAAGSATSSTVMLLVKTTFAQWQIDYFNAQQMAAGLAADHADPSGDGVPNLLKYALDLDPDVPVSGDVLPDVTCAAGGPLQINFTRDVGRTDIDYVVEATTNLSTAAANGWTPVAEGDGGATVAAVNGRSSVTETAVTGTSRMQVTVQAVPPASGGAQFLRLRIVRP